MGGPECCGTAHLHQRHHGRAELARDAGAPPSAPGEAGLPEGCLRVREADGDLSPHRHQADYRPHEPCRREVRPRRRRRVLLDLLVMKCEVLAMPWSVMLFFRIPYPASEVDA